MAGSRLIYVPSSPGQSTTIASALPLSAEVSQQTRWPSDSDPQTLDLLVQRRRLEAEDLGGALLHSSGLPKSRLDQVPLVALEGVVQRGPLRQRSGSGGGAAG